MLNYQVYFNDTLLVGNKTLDRNAIKNSARAWLQEVMPKRYHTPVSFVVDAEDMSKGAIPEPIRTMVVNGYNHDRSGSLIMILNPAWFESDRFTGTTHGNWNPYDTHIPLIFYGWNIQRGETHEQVNMTDISPTLAALLHIQMPNGCIGKPITQVIK